MTRLLKCIGGSADGEIRDVPLSYQQITVRVPTRITHCMKVTARNFVTYTETVYVIGNVAVGKDVVEFLRPQDWTPLQTLQHVFGT